MNPLATLFIVFVFVKTFSRSDYNIIILLKIIVFVFICNSLLWMIFFLESADSTTINDIAFTKSNEVAAATFGGQMKVWDLRQPSDKPGRTMLLYVCY